MAELVFPSLQPGVLGKMTTDDVSARTANGAGEKKPRVAFVVQRYGTEVNGGAEVLCRGLVEHMAPFWDVEVLTSCSCEYVYRFENDYPGGISLVNSICVRRFPVDYRRSEPAIFSKLDQKVPARLSPPEEDDRWLREVGPQCSGLQEYLRSRARDFDLFVFFTYLYWTTNSILPQVRNRALLVPTAHDEPPIYARPFDALFTLPRAVLCSTPEEEAFLRRRTGGDLARSEIVGAGVNLAAGADAARFRARFDIPTDYVIYIGRVQKEKGCDELFSHYLCLPSPIRQHFPLVVLGKAAMPIPESPDIRHLGFVDDMTKQDALAGATLLIAPSRFESLSLVALEAWLSGVAVLVNGDCDVLKGLCRRTQGGLWYHGGEEFREVFAWLTAPENRRLRLAMAENGRRSVQERHCWDKVVDKYLHALDDVRETRRA